MSALRVLGLSVALASCSLTSGLAAADEGETLYKVRACHSCHGDDGKTTALPIYPKLAGQNAPYLLDQMKAIRDGTRTSKMAVAMQQLMSSISDDEFAAIADWLSKLN